MTETLSDKIIGKKTDGVLNTSDVKAFIKDLIETFDYHDVQDYIIEMAGDYLI